jgi:hypothetical protein
MTGFHTWDKDGNLLQTGGGAGATGAPLEGSYITGQPEAALPNSFALSDLIDGIMKNMSGLPAIAEPLDFPSYQPSDGIDPSVPGVVPGGQVVAPATAATKFFNQSGEFVEPPYPAPPAAAPPDATYITLTSNANLSNELALGSIGGSGFMFYSSAGGMIILDDTAYQFLILDENGYLDTPYFPRLAGDLENGIANQALIKDNAVGLAKIAHGDPGRFLGYDAAGAPAELLPLPIFIAQFHKASGSAAGASVATTWTNVPFTRIMADTIGGVSLDGSGRVVLPSGTYRIKAQQTIFNSSSFKARIRLVCSSDPNSPILGFSQLGNSNSLALCQVEGRLVVSGGAYVSMEYWTNLAKTSNGLGDNTSAGVDEVYGQIICYRERF